MEYLQSYSWPGNVKELKNVIEHAVIMCQTDMITKDDLQLNVKTNSGKPEFNTLCLDWAVEELEKTIIKEALAKAQNNKSKAIKYLGISRIAFYAKLEKYNMC
jgi:DNA-binding NtrC family response regulator